jgi:hypothetical protein
VIGTVQKGKTGSRAVFHETGGIGVLVRDPELRAKSIAAVTLALGADGDAGQRLAEPLAGRSEDAKAKTLLSDVSKALTELAAAQDDFRAELIAAYEEGEELFKLATG